MTIRWKELLLALLMTVALWYSLSGTEEMETQVDVRVEYKGIPKGHVVRGNGLTNKISVRVSGPAGQMRAMGLRDHVLVMDLSSLKKGKNVIPVEPPRGQFFGDIQIIDINPPSLVLDVDIIESKEIPLNAETIGVVPKELAVAATLVPNKVTVRGPSEELAAITALSIPLEIGDIVNPGTIESDNEVSLPGVLEVDPPVVKGIVTIDFKRKRATVQRNITLDAPKDFGVFIRPAKASITVALPEAIAAGAASNNEIRAFVTVPEVKLGTFTVPVKVRLPDGGQLIRVDPAQVTVTLEQKQ